MLQQSKKLYETLLVSDQDKGTVTAELGKLILSRQEEIDDYNLELWIEHFTERGFSFPEMMEAVKMAKDLRKYGGTKLAIGDVIDNYENNKAEETPINWTQFLRILSIYEKKAMEQINKLVGGNHITVSDYFRHKQYLENQFKKLYGVE